MAVMRSLNSHGSIVTHAPAPGDGELAPLCGFVATTLDGVDVSETVTTDPDHVTCLDCLAASGRYSGAGLDGDQHGDTWHILHG